MALDPPMTDGKGIRGVYQEKAKQPEVLISLEDELIAIFLMNCNYEVRHLGMNCLCFF